MNVLISGWRCPVGLRVVLRQQYTHCRNIAKKMYICFTKTQPAYEV